MSQPPPQTEAFERYRQYLLTLARVQIDPKVRHKLDASDVVQQTLMEACRQRDQFRGTSDGQMAAWLRQILVHNLADALRSLRRAKRDIARERHLADAMDRSSAWLGTWLAADQTSPSLHARREEQAIVVADALAQLPQAQREALVFQHWHGWTLKEIAGHMDRTPAAVAGLLKRGLKHLRQLLGEQEPSREKGELSDERREH